MRFTSIRSPHPHGHAMITHRLRPLRLITKIFRPSSEGIRRAYGSTAAYFPFAGLLLVTGGRKTVGYFRGGYNAHPLKRMTG
jgi:hypothetical protein